MKQSWSKEEIAAIASDITDEAIDENIEANPTLEGDEETLSSIGIKGVNYAIGGGSEVHLYQHHILLFESGQKFLTINITSSSSVAYTYATLHAYIRTITNNTEAAGQGYDCISKNGSYYGYSCCAASNDYIYSANYDGQNSFYIAPTATVTDTITQIF